MRARRRALRLALGVLLGVAASARAQVVLDDSLGNHGEPVGSGLDPNLVDEDWMRINVAPDPAIGSTITDASFVSLSADKRFMTINFTQAGADPATVVVELVHSLQR